eukprot:10154611-Alexandrium_andersonii.AAC.1
MELYAGGRIGGDAGKMPCAISGLFPYASWSSIHLPTKNGVDLQVFAARLAPRLFAELARSPVAQRFHERGRDGDGPWSNRLIVHIIDASVVNEVTAA